jgi:hypothetical protein
MQVQWNRLSSLPAAIGQLTALARLHVRSWSHTRHSLAVLTIIVLQLNLNRLRSLPREIGRLRSLRRLEVGFLCDFHFLACSLFDSRLFCHDRCTTMRSCPSHPNWPTCKHFVFSMCVRFDHSCFSHSQNPPVVFESTSLAPFRARALASDDLRSCKSIGCLVRHF